MKILGLKLCKWCSLPYLVLHGIFVCMACDGSDIPNKEDFTQQGSEA